MGPFVGVACACVRCDGNRCGAVHARGRRACGGNGLWVQKRLELDNIERITQNRDLDCYFQQLKSLFGKLAHQECRNLQL